MISVLFESETWEAHDFARQFDMFYMETSAKNEQNVEEAFVTLAKERVTTWSLTMLNVDCKDSLNMTWPTKE